MFKKLFMFLGIGYLVTGCALEEEHRLDSTEQLTASALINCDPLNCTGNSDLIALLGPYELNEDRKSSNSRGFVIAGVEHPKWGITDFVVNGTSPVATTTDGGKLSGANLVGLKLTLHYEDPAHVYPSQDYFLEIAQYLSNPEGGSGVKYYTGEYSQINGYYVKYNVSSSPEGPQFDLCPYTDVEPDMVGSWAVFWKGDRIDPRGGRIWASNGAVDSWFNISCAGEAPVKMLRARTGGAVAPQSPVEQRQATLNMFTASYCGPNGHRYTHLGVPITWSDKSGPNQIGQVASYEAVWNQNGAVCLVHPRLGAWPGCSIDPCEPLMITKWSSLGWLLSGNPPPPEL